MSQYVIMGAGMDTFAFRRPELVEKLQIFEMDQPATQGFKRHRITELGWEIPAGLHFVPVDFTRESLAEALSRSAYNPRSQSFFSWLGVTHYLPREAVSATLRSISGAAPAGSLVVFDYYDTDAFIPEKASQRVQAILKLTRGIGEPVNTGFDPSTLAASLAHLGLHLLDDLGPADIQERFFQGRTDDYFAYEHVHYACAAVK